MYAPQSTAGIWIVFKFFHDLKTLKDSYMKALPAPIATDCNREHLKGQGHVM